MKTNAITRSLKDYINNEDLLLSNYNDLNIVDLVKCLYSRYGVDCEKTDNIKKLEKIIPEKKHTIFILIDGMGSNLVNILGDNSILKKNKVTDMITVSPSSTGCVLTSLATATYPNEHGIIGWYNYNKEYNVDYYPLLFSSRKEGKSLKELGIKVSDIFKKSSKLNELNVNTTVLYPDYIADSIYSNYVAIDDIRKSYNNIEDAFDKIIEITSSNDKTFTYLYISSIDSLEHVNGVESKVVLKEIKKIENQLNRLNNEDIITVITADHGQTNVDINKDIIMDFEKYEKYFYAYPGIDFGMATYYVKKELEEEFVNEFEKDFKDKMYLFKTNEFIENNIFGPEKPSEYLLDNLGEYISLCNSDSQFINSKEVDKYHKKTKGNHSGLTRDEMIIPLIIIDKNN